MKKPFLLTIFLLLFIQSFSQEKKESFTLEEAINYAIEHNYIAINAKRDIEAAKKQKWETTATGLPQISATIDYQNWLKQQISLIPAEFFGGNSGEFAEVAFGTKQNINATATLNQLLFDGSYLVGLQSAKVFLEISENAKEKTELEVRKTVIDAYGNVLLAEESIKILEKNRATLAKNLDETQKIYENGLEEEESVEQLQITLTSIESNLKNTIRLKDLSYKMLNITLGIAIDEKIILKDNLTSLTLENINLNLIATPLNLEDNIDFKIAKNNKRSQELLLKLEKSKALPSLSAFINGGYSGNNDSFDFLKNEQQWFGSSLVGVSLHVPIFSSFGRSAKTQRAKINLEKAKTELTQTEQQLKLQVANARSNYQFIIEQYQTAKKNLELAARIENKNQIKFFEGIGSSFELRQAQIQLYSTQQEYLQTMLDVINKKAELETILNKIK
jgi:outer membrane protein TolC